MLPNNIISLKDCILLAALFSLTGAPAAQAGAENAAAKPEAAIATPSLSAVEPEAHPREPVPISIFFSPEELEQVRAALIAYEKSKYTKSEDKGNDFLNQLTGMHLEPEPAKPAEIKTFMYPQFFLNSLVFHTLDDWVVLINNQRFSAKEVRQSDELSILGVGKESVSVEWKPKNMQKVNETWEAAKNDDAVVDKVHGVVAFTLRPNQTFSSYAMRVLEGKMQPMIVVLKGENGESAPPPEAAASEEETKKP